jgi:hypothetical protein
MGMNDDKIGRIAYSKVDSKISDVEPGAHVTSKLRQSKPALWLFN